MTTEEARTLIELDREIEKHPEAVPQTKLRRYKELLTKHIAEASSAPVLRVRPRGSGPHPERLWVA